jgi:rubrerythrin
MSKTEKNLKEAFAGESQANRKYLAFAKPTKKVFRRLPNCFVQPRMPKRCMPSAISKPWGEFNPPGKI